MFCTSCGTAIVPEQAVCGKCGSPTSVGVMQGGGRRVSEHYQMVGILEIVYSALIAIAGIVIVVVMRTMLPFIFSHAHDGTPPPPFVLDLIMPLVSVVGWLVFAKGAVGIVAGIGLLNRVPWARTLTLVVAFLSLLSVPFGTAFGIYAIWVFLSAGAQREYEQLAVSHAR
jgi:hypothetical protein